MLMCCMYVVLGCNFLSCLMCCVLLLFFLFIVVFLCPAQITGSGTTVNM